MPRFSSALLVLVLAAVACKSDSRPTDPGGSSGGGGGGGGCGGGAPPATETVTQNIELPNVFAASQSGDGALDMRSLAPIEIRRIRLTVYTVPANTVVFQKDYDVDPGAGKWTLSFTAPRGATVQILAELMSVTNGVTKVEYSGRSAPVTINPCAPNCVPIPVQTYPGPVENLDATSVAVTPKTASVVVGATTSLSATAQPSGRSFTIVWRSLDEAIATVASTGVVTGVKAGSARIIAAVGPRADTATIAVTAPPPPPSINCVATAYTVGSTVGGEWTTSDCLAASGSGRRYDMYELTLTQQTAFRASVTGPAGRRISLRRAGTDDYLQVMAGEAFMPAAANPQVVRYILPAGSYVIEIATPDATTLGSYSLATSMDPATGCTPLTFVAPGVTITDRLDAATDCAGIGTEDRFIILPDVGQRLTLALQTASFAPVLVFRDDRQGPASPILARDIRTTVSGSARVDYTTTFAGFHEIVVSHTNPNGSGAYSLAIGSGNATNSCQSIPTTIGSTRQAVFENSDCRSGTMLADRYPFTITSQVGLRASIASDAAPKQLGIFAGGTEVLNWQRTPTGTLEAVWFLAPGTYDLQAAAGEAAAGVSYTVVTSTENNIGCTSNSTTGNVSFSGQVLGGADCTFDGGFEDRLVLYVEAGKEITVTMDGSMAPVAIIRDPLSTPGIWLVRSGRTTPGTVTATWRAATTGYYQAIFRTNFQGATGTYSGSITVR